MQPLYAKTATAMILAVIVSGCATRSQYVDRFAGLSCSELDQEIGAAKYKRKSARWDQVGSALTSLSKDGKTSTSDDLGEASHHVAELDAKNRLKAARELKREQNCR